MADCAPFGNDRSTPLGRFMRIASARNACASGELDRLQTATHMSDADVAAALEISRENVGRWKRQVAVPRADAALRLADLLDRLASLVAS